MKKTTKAKADTAAAAPKPRTNGKKKAASKPVEEPVEEPAAAEEDNEDNDAKENEDVLVLATELDSDDEDNAVTLFEEGQDVGTIPGVSQAVRDAAAKAAPTGDKGVIYIGRIPHGFYEHEMRLYFSQFGPISRLRLSRNKRTGASKHFAFVEFEEASTAEIVTKTMDNYLLFGHILKCKVVPKESVHEALFKGANRRFKKVPWNKMAGRNLAKPLSESAWQAKVDRENGRRADKAKKLKALGYDFDAPEIKAIPAPGVVVPVATEENGDTTESEAAAPVEEAKVEEPKAEEPKAKSPKVTKAKGGKAKKAKA